MEGVRLLEVRGHAWGTMCLMVDLPHTGTMIFTSDAAYMKESYGPPSAGSPIVYDSLAWLNSVERIRSFATLRDATIVFGHDPKLIKEIRLAPRRSMTSSDSGSRSICDGPPWACQDG